MAMVVHGAKAGRCADCGARVESGRLHMCEVVQPRGPIRLARVALAIWAAFGIWLAWEARRELRLERAATTECAR